MSVSLEAGFCVKANIAKTSADLGDVVPILQILSIKKLPGATGAPDRHRLIISDGELFMQAMLSTSLNDQIEDGTFRRNAAVKLIKWEPQTLKEQRYACLSSQKRVSRQQNGSSIILFL
jgi:replication factor A1